MTTEINSLSRKWSNLDQDKLRKIIIVSSIMGGFVFNPINVMLIYKRLGYTGSTKDCFKMIMKTNGIKGFYRGVGISCAGTFCVDSLFIPNMEYYKEKGLPEVANILGLINVSTFSQLQKDCLAGFFSHLIVLPISTPFSLIANKQMAGGLKDSYPYQPVHSMAKTIIKNEGITGLFRGIAISTLYVPFYAGWWTLYSTNKNIGYDIYKKYNNNNSDNIFVSSKDNVIINGISGGIAGIFLCLAINPLDVLYTKIQSQKILKNTNNVKSFNLIKNIYSTNGIKGFYRGAYLNCLTKFMECTVYSITYDGIKQMSSKKN